MSLTPEETRPPTTHRIKRRSIKPLWDFLDPLIAAHNGPGDCIDVMLTMRFNRVTGELIALVDHMTIDVVDDKNPEGGAK